jgi:hypothetical protein
MSKPKYRVPQPQRLRRITTSFAWIDHRLVRDGYLAVMTHQDQSLYLFLALAADRHGVSFYRKEKICDLLGLDFGAFEVARDRLVNLGLLAFAPYSALSVNGFYQLLPIDQPAPDPLTLTPAITPAIASPPAAPSASAPPSVADLTAQLAGAFRGV